MRCGRSPSRFFPCVTCEKAAGCAGAETRLVLDSVFYVLRSGCQWRMLPRDLMPWDAAHRWFPKWRRDGTWDRIHDELHRQVRIGAGRVGGGPVRGDAGSTGAARVLAGQRLGGPPAADGPRPDGGR
ncbi:transposase [Streptomyces sp. NPDC127106]|uniref:transposase n=1 Tax=Streptomyces sp. NPDC127106 TaxID=3345360 RepID=UPI0036384A84